MFRRLARRELGDNPTPSIDRRAQHHLRGKGPRQYGRIVAICRPSGEDIGTIMVREGMAWAFVRYSRDYVDQEAKAKAEQLGVHAHGCQSAWEWRAQQQHERVPR